MYCFVAGVDPAAGNIEERMNMLLQEVQNYEGFIQVGLNDAKPWLCVLCFKDKESATAAQWMMELNGSEPREGGAGGERDTEHTDDDNRQPGNGEGGGSAAGGG